LLLPLYEYLHSAYKARIEDLEEELNAQKTLKTGWMNLDSKVMKLKNTHGKLLLEIYA